MFDEDRHTSTYAHTGIDGVALCGACARLEKALKDAFGDLVKMVEEVPTEAPKVATAQLVDRFLDQLRPAITNYKVR
jgi:hypothetical protein